METRPQFLTLSVVLTFLGTAIAWYHGPVSLGYALLAGVGLMLTHGSVNAINDYFVYPGNAGSRIYTGEIILVALNLN